jgi:hypothetical protein
MARVTTNMDMQRATFVESLHRSLRKQASKAIADHKKFIVLANTYMEDGLDESEAVELLMIDGLSREAAESFISMAMNKESSTEDGLIEYSFQFENTDEGSVCTSHDINKTIRAANDEEAWVKAEEAIDEAGIESAKILSVNRIE